jgi:hypothetical protein
MVDERLEDTDAPADPGRPKRPPPTIDLDASEVSSETKPAPETPPQAQAAEAAPEPAPESEPASVPEAETEPETRVSPPRRAISPWVIAPFSGGVAAALVIGVGWLLGWPPVQPPSHGPAPETLAIEQLNTRVATLESKVGKPVSPVTDPAMAARVGEIAKSEAALRDELAKLRAQTDKLASAAPAAGQPTASDSAGTADVAALNDRITELERATAAQSAALATQGDKLADARPPDDVPLRRVVAAALLDVAVRHGDPFTQALAAAKSLAPDASALKPLEAFASTGVPNPFMLNRELMALVPKLTPAAPENSTTGTGVLDRLQAGAAKLVTIERTDGVGNDRGAIVARITAAALRNDLPEARRELDALSATDRAPAQAWIDRAAARDAALAASRHFADDALAALAKASQKASQ